MTDVARGLEISHPPDLGRSEETPPAGRPPLGRAGLIGAVLLGLAGPACSEPILDPVAVWTLSGDLEGEDRPPAYDVSGIACLPPEENRRPCLIVNDQNTFAQWVTLADRQILVGETVPLIPDGPAPDPATLGAAPDPGANCPELGGFKDLDGEGVAYAEPYLYIVGSHGCSRYARKFHLSAYILARVRVGGDGRILAQDGGVPAPAERPAQTTYRLSDALRAAAPVNDLFSKELGANGLNVEGVAVVGDTLYAGLRAPSLHGTAYLVGAKLADLFAPGHGPMPDAPTVIELPLGEGVGIRDLAALSDGRLLVLSGPAHNADGPYDLHVANPSPGAGATHLGTLAALRGPNAKGREVVGKAEALLVLREDPLEILVLFDGLRNGAPREYHLGAKP